MAPPPAPTVILTSPNPGELLVSWAQVVGADSYNVYYDDDPLNPPWDPVPQAAEGAPPINVLDGPSPSLLLTALVPTVTYFIRVSSVSIADGEGPLSVQQSLSPACPVINIIRACVDLPKNLRVEETGFLPVPFIRVKWDVTSLVDWQETWAKTLTGNEDPVDMLDRSLVNAINCKAAAAPSTVGYRLYRDEVPCSPFAPVPGNLIADETVLTGFVGEFVDTGITLNTQYVYFIEVVGLVS